MDSKGQASDKVKLENEAVTRRTITVKKETVRIKREDSIPTLISIHSTTTTSTPPPTNEESIGPFPPTSYNEVVHDNDNNNDEETETDDDLPDITKPPHILLSNDTCHMINDTNDDNEEQTEEKQQPQHICLETNNAGGSGDPPHDNNDSGGDTTDSISPPRPLRIGTCNICNCIPPTVCNGTECLDKALDRKRNREPDNEPVPQRAPALRVRVERISQADAANEEGQREAQSSAFDAAPNVQSLNDSETIRNRRIYIRDDFFNNQVFVHIPPNKPNTVFHIHLE